MITKVDATNGGTLAIKFANGETIYISTNNVYIAIKEFTEKYGDEKT